MRRTLVPVSALLVTANLIASTTESDVRLMEQMQHDIASLQTQIVTTSDIEQKIQLQKAIIELQDAALKKLSPESRVFYASGIKLWQPIQTSLQQYMQSLADFSHSGEARFAGIDSRDEIKKRIARIKGLQATNRRLIERADRFEADTLALVDAEPVSAEEKQRFIAGLAPNIKGVVSMVKNVRKFDDQIYQQLEHMHLYLDAHWGEWQSDAKGLPTWTDPESERAFTKMLSEINSLAIRQGQAQESAGKISNFSP